MTEIVTVVAWDGGWGIDWQQGDTAEFGDENVQSWL